VSAVKHMFGEAPARDERFDVKERWRELANYDEGDPRKEFEFLHRQMNEEINGLENSARCLTDFPDADWELRMWIARQCADEARHIVMFRDMFERRGGTVGQFPVINFQYRIISNISTLAARLGVQNRSFEADGIDAIRFAMDESRANGDDELAALFDAQLADEINHVRFANEWIHTLVKRQPILGLRIASALHDASLAFEAAMGGGTAVMKYDVDETVRREAGFDAGEVAAAQIAAATRRGERAEG
jgi:uncharacterized ferritin-like protein (DUF455 family)